MSKFEVTGTPKVCKNPTCDDETRPNTLSVARGDASMVPGQEDHLVAVRVDTKDAILFMPAHVAREDWKVQPDEQITGAKSMVVAVPNTVTAMRLLENATKGHPRTVTSYCDTVREIVQHHGLYPCQHTP